MKDNQGNYHLIEKTPPSGWPSIELTPNSLTILQKRYLRKGEDGKTPIETVDEMFFRIAKHVALAEESDELKSLHTREFYDMLTMKKFFPNTPTFTGAGTPLGQLAACFVLPIDDDLGRMSTSIFSSLRNAALIQQTGGGNGFSFSRLRPKKSIVKTSGGESTGPVGFLRVFDSAFGVIAQGGTRRGANMAVLRVDHPDIREFITCKASEHAITNFNISVGITDKFMHAVKNNLPFELVAPHTKEVTETVDARDLFDLIVRYAHHNGEPGVLFLDSANRANPVPHLYELESTNPCGEQWLGPYENCCLGSINLGEHVTKDNKVDWVALERSIRLATRFLDNVVQVNSYVPAVPELKEAAFRCRRIGLGIMGLADIMCTVGVRYGSTEGEIFAGQLIEFVRYHSMNCSVDLAIERGAFPAIKGSIYDPDNFRWKVPSPLPSNDFPKDEYADFNKFYDAKQIAYNRPALNWNALRDRILKYGIRNSAQTTIAPTGTIATVSGCEGYGCEPKFALAYIRHVNDNGKDLVLKYSSPLFGKALDQAGYSDSEKERILDQVLQTGSCQQVDGLADQIKNRFVVAADITPTEHVRMQAALQAFIDNSISKTCNLPEGASEQDVAQCYMNAWEFGCKGITVYVTGSRKIVVIETKKEIDAKLKEEKEKEEKEKQEKEEKERQEKERQEKENIKNAPQVVFSTDKIETSNNNMTPGKAPSRANSRPSSPPSLPSINKPAKKLIEKRTRPKLLRGFTITEKTPVGKAYITINEDQADFEPFEVFINTSKAGSETAAVSEAFGRLISYILRINSPVDPTIRLKHVAEQLFGIGGRRSFGFGSMKVLSLPDGIAKGIQHYFVSKVDYSHLHPNNYQIRLPEDVDAVESSPKKPFKPVAKNNNNNSNNTSKYRQLFGDLCPDCGDASFIFEEGCKKCYSCGYSEC